MPTLDPTVILPQLIREHTELNAAIDAEQLWWKEVRELGKPQFGEMGVRLQTLRARLAAHFAHEERAEEEAVAEGLCKAPPAEIAAMKSEHRDLLARLDAIISKASSCGASYDCWGDVGCEFGDLIQRLHEHETAELTLLGEILGKVQSRACPAPR